MHWIYLLASGAEATTTTSLSRSVLVAAAAAGDWKEGEAVYEEGAGDKQDGQLFYTEYAENFRPQMDVEPRELLGQSS